MPTHTPDSPTDTELHEGPSVPLFYEFAECRLNHRFRLRPDNPVRQSTGDYRFTWDCEGCGARKWQTVDAFGGARSPGYALPDGYSLEKGLVKAHFRVHMINEMENR